MIVQVNDLLGGAFGLLNVYSPHTTLERTTLWEHLASTTDNSWPWLVGGDFNMTLYASDQMGGIAGDLAGSEYVAWTEFANSVNLVDTFNGTQSQLAFMWDNNRVDIATNIHSARVLKCLDRLYISTDLRAMFPVAHTKVLQAQMMSDHLSIQLVLQEPQVPKRGPFHVQEKYLLNEDLQEKIRFDWLTTTKLMKDHPSRAILRKCSRRATKLIQQWTIQEEARRANRVAQED